MTRKLVKGTIVLIIGTAVKNYIGNYMGKRFSGYAR